MKETELTFLVGCPRSGTTWLQMMLANHPDISTSQESHIFNKLLGSSIKAWKKKLDSLRSTEHGRGGLVAYLTEEEFIELMQNNVYQILSKSNEFNTSKIFLEKTPDHSLFIEEINYIFPNIKFIYLSRNPYDVVESLLSASKGWGSHWAPNSTRKAIKTWIKYTTSLHTSLSKIDNTKKVTISYEALKENPKEKIKILLDFLQLNSTPEIINKMIENRQPLKVYGEIAKINGNIVKEPPGFARSKKEKLNLIQKTFIYLMTIRARPLAGY